jgi:hypothetical protein
MKKPLSWLINKLIVISHTLTRSKKWFQAFIYTFRFAVRAVRIAILRPMFINRRKLSKAMFLLSSGKLKIFQPRPPLTRFTLAVERLRF